MIGSLNTSGFLILVFPPSVPHFHVITSISLFNLHFFYPWCSHKWASQPQISSYERGHADGSGHVTLLATAWPPLHHSLDALPGFSAQWCSRTVSRCRTKMHYRSVLRHRRRTDDHPGPRWAVEGWVERGRGGGSGWKMREEAGTAGGLSQWEQSESSISLTAACMYTPTASDRRRRPLCSLQLGSCVWKWKRDVALR